MPESEQAQQQLSGSPLARSGGHSSPHRRGPGLAGGIPARALRLLWPPLYLLALPFSLHR